MAQIKSPRFEIVLGGFEMSAAQVKALEAELKKVALQHLAKIDKGSSVSYKPHPDSDGSGGYIQWKPFPINPPIAGFWPIRSILERNVLKLSGPQGDIAINLGNAQNLRNQALNIRKPLK